MNSNDKKIQELFNKVQAKKAEIQKTERPSWKTNCSFSFDVGQTNGRVNIQVVTDIDVLLDAAAFLCSFSNGFYEACAHFKIENRKCLWNGYSVEDWFSDFSTRIDKIKIQEKKSELANLEERLNQIVSPELRASLEIDAITKTLNE